MPVMAHTSANLLLPFATLVIQAHREVPVCGQRYAVQGLSVLAVQVLISKWDPALSRRILAHWLDLMDADGWIAREQVQRLHAC